MCLCVLSQVPVTWESVSVKPVKTADGRVTVPEEVLQSMERNKIGLKGMSLQSWLVLFLFEQAPHWMESSASCRHVNALTLLDPLLQAHWRLRLGKEPSLSISHYEGTVSPGCVRG